MAVTIRKSAPRKAQPAKSAQPSAPKAETKPTEAKPKRELTEAEKIGDGTRWWAEQ